MTQKIELEMSLAKWAETLEISASTLAKWAYQKNLEAPFDSSKMKIAISHGQFRSERARGASKQNALINLEKIERASTWL